MDEKEKAAFKIAIVALSDIAEQFLGAGGQEEAAYGMRDDAKKAVKEIKKLLNYSDKDLVSIRRAKT